MHHPVARAAAGLAALLLASNIAAAADTAQMSTRNAPKPVARSEQASVKAPSSSEMACLAEAVYFEAGGTGQAGQAAVAHVVMNRTKSAKFPGTVCGVVGQGCQFSYRCDGKSDALSNADDRARAYRVAQAVLSGEPDITNGALFFHSASAKPGWFASRKRVGTFGGNIFYR